MEQKLDATLLAEQNALANMYNVIDSFSLNTGRIRREPRKGAEFPFGKQLNIELKGGTAARRRSCASAIAQRLGLMFTIRSAVKGSTVDPKVTVVNFTTRRIF